MSKERLKKIESYGEVDYLTDGEKINLIEDKFKRATIEGSAFSDELRLLNDKYGMYQNIRNTWQLCEIEKTKDREWGEYYKTKHIEELTLSKLFEIIKNEDIEKYYYEQIEEYYNRNKFYYELDINQKKSYKEVTDYIHFYIELLGNWFEINIDSSRYIEIKSRDFQISNEYLELKDGLDELIDKEIMKYIGKNIVKLENGYVYKNTYYEDFEDIKEVLDKE